MNEQNSPATETPDQTLVGRIQVGWGFWALWVVALAAVGALSYRGPAEAPLADFSLPPMAMIIFGFLAGGVHAFALRRQAPPARWWVLASSLAGFVAALVSLLSTSLAATSVGLLAGWAYGWAVYGAVFGVMLQRIFPSRWLMLASLAGWATAGIVSGAVGWALDVLVVTALGAVCGATGAAITGAAIVRLSPTPVLPPGDGERQAKDAKLVNIAGVVSGLIAAALSTYVAPLVVTKLTQGSLDSLDLTIYFFNMLAGTAVCIPTIAVVSIPLAIGCGYAGLEIGRAIGRPHSRLLVWCGAALGGVAGYVLGSLVAFAIGSIPG